jgi:tetratricopeptide (TPR) repeat protein
MEMSESLEFWVIIIEIARISVISTLILPAALIALTTISGLEVQLFDEGNISVSTKWGLFAVLVPLAALANCAPTQVSNSNQGSISGQNTSCTYQPPSETAEHLNCVGYGYFTQGKYDLAIPYFKKAIDLNHNYATAFCNIGASYVNLNEYDKSIENYNIALNLDPNNAITWNGRGNAYIGKKLYALGIQDLKKAIQLNPNFAFPHFALGRAYYEQSQFNDAIPEFNEAIRIDKNDKLSFYGRAVAYYYIGNKEKSLSDFDKARSLDPSLAPPAGFFPTS